MNKTSGQTSLWLVWSLRLQDSQRWTFDEDQIILLFPRSAEEQQKESQRLLASKQYTFAFLLPPDTLTPLSHPHHELYIICANGKSPILTWNVGASCLASAEPLTGPALFLCNFRTTKCWALFKDGVKGNKDRENKRGVKWDLCQKIIETGRRSKTIGEFPPAPTITPRNKRYNKKYEAKENKYRGNMEEAPCGLIIRATPQVLYSLTAVLYKFCHLVKTVRTTDPPFPSNWPTGILKLILLTTAVWLLWLST